MTFEDGEESRIGRTKKGSGERNSGKKKANILIEISPPNYFQQFLLVWKKKKQF